MYFSRVFETCSDVVDSGPCMQCCDSNKSEKVAHSTGIFLWSQKVHAEIRVDLLCCLCSDGMCKTGVELVAVLSITTVSPKVSVYMSANLFHCDQSMLINDGSGNASVVWNTHDLSPI